MYKRPLRPDELYHWSLGNFKPKYLDKIKVGDTFRYFYSQEEIDAFKQGLKRAGEKVGNGVNTLRKNAGILGRNLKKDAGQAMNTLGKNAGILGKNLKKDVERKAGEAANNARERIGEAAKNIRSKKTGRDVEDRLTEAKRTAEDTAKKVRRGAEDLGVKARRGVEDLTRNVGRKIEDKRDEITGNDNFINKAKKKVKRMQEDTARSGERKLEDSKRAIGRSADDFATGASRKTSDAKKSVSRKLEDAADAVEQTVGGKPKNKTSKDHIENGKKKVEDFFKKRFSGSSKSKKESNPTQDHLNDLLKDINRNTEDLFETGRKLRKKGKRIG